MVKLLNFWRHNFAKSSLIIHIISQLILTFFPHTIYLPFASHLNDVPIAIPKHISNLRNTVAVSMTDCSLLKSKAHTDLTFNFSIYQTTLYSEHNDILNDFLKKNLRLSDCQPGPT